MKKYISSLLISCMLLQLYGCYSMQNISIEELKQPLDKNNIAVFTKDSVSYELSRNYIIKNDSIIGKGFMNNWNRDKKDAFFDSRIAISDIQFIQTEKYNSTNTFLLAAGIGVGVILIVGIVVVTQNLNKPMFKGVKF
jgi:hypothetical protein